MSRKVIFFPQSIASKVNELSPKTTELIYELIANIGVRSVTDIANLLKKMNEEDYHLIFDQIKDIYDFVENDIEALRNSQEVFKIVPGGYLNINSQFNCSDLDCRYKALESACKKLIFYADIVCLNDILLPPLTSIGKSGLTYSNIDDFAGALTLMLLMKPLAEQGMLLLFPDIGNWSLCEKCTKKLISETHIDLDKACDIFCTRNKLTLYRELNNDYAACFRFGDSDLHDLWSPLDADEVPKALSSKLTNIDSEGRFYYQVTTQDAKDIGILRNKVSKICLQLDWEATLAERIAGSMVTDSFSEWDLLNKDLQLSNLAKVEKNFEIPFIANLKLEDIIAIRKSEPISFEKFRITLSQIKDEFTYERSFSQKDLAYYVKNRIIPEINIIDEDLKRIKRGTFVKSVAASAIAGMFAAIGFYEGAYSPILFSALQQIGLLGIAFEGFHLCSEHIQANQEIKNRAPYFLWKAKTLGEKM